LTLDNEFIINQMQPIKLMFAMMEELEERRVRVEGLLIARVIDFGAEGN
jgi:MoxR-like ATPase